MKGEREPPIEIRNAQRTIKVATERLQSFAQKACALAWKQKRRGSSMSSISGISGTIVTDRRMAKVHKQFCGIAGTTDVLTFQHGEIVISAETALLQARRFRSTLEKELCLYLVHGLLHLCGFNDHPPAERATMSRLQDKIYREASIREKREHTRLRRLNRKSRVLA